MAEEIEQLKQLQVAMNAAFDRLLKSTQESPNNGKAIAEAKQQIGTMAEMTLGAVLGPAFSIISLSAQVSLRIALDAGNPERKEKQKLTSPKPYAYLAVRVALDLKLFELISKSKSTSLDEIVQKTDADPVILQRILRAVCSIGYL